MTAQDHDGAEARAREIVRACYDAEPPHRMPLTGGACTACIAAALRAAPPSGLTVLTAGNPEDAVPNLQERRDTVGPAAVSPEAKARLGPDAGHSLTPDVEAAAPAGYSREAVDRIASIRERLAKTTPAPWTIVVLEDARGNTRFKVDSAAFEDEDPGICGDHSKFWPLIEADAEFIAHAPADVAWLLAHLPSPPGSPPGGAA